jgi:hypothetical protein
MLVVLPGIKTADSADFTDFEGVIGGTNVRISSWQNFRALIIVTG